MTTALEKPDMNTDVFVLHGRQAVEPVARIHADGHGR